MTSRRIDVHAHYFGGAVETFLRSLSRPVTPPWTPEGALALMDEHRIRAQILSLPFTPAEAGLARQVNHEYASLIEAHPGRFGAFAAVPGNDAGLMLTEIAYALDTLHLDGIALTSNIKGQYLGAPFFEPILAELDRRRVPVLIHPTDCPHAAELALGRSRSVIEFPFDTARNMTNALYTGVFQRYRNLRLILPHCGGPLPSLAWRLAANTELGRGPDDAPITPDHIRTVLQNLYYETAMAGSRHSLLPVLEVTDIHHLLLGTDWPAAPSDIVTQNLHLLSTFGFEDTALAAIEHTNALRLFPRLADAPFETFAP